MTLVTRTNGDPLKLVDSVRNQVQAVDRDQPISKINTMDVLFERTFSHVASILYCWRSSPASRFCSQPWVFTA